MALLVAPSLAAEPIGKSVDIAVLADGAIAAIIVSVEDPASPHDGLEDVQARNVELAAALLESRCQATTSVREGDIGVADRPKFCGGDVKAQLVLG